MFQDIAPHKFDNQFINREISEDDHIVIFDDSKVLFKENDLGGMLPKYGDLPKDVRVNKEELIYLFSVDDTGFFLYKAKLDIIGYKYKRNRAAMNLEPDWLSFAAATAFHLAEWYESCNYCGKCSAPMEHRENERAMYCPICGYTEYPRISPVVIVGITDGDRLLLTKYSNAAYKRYALVAGFVEIGETPEDAVRREVLEEVGVNVKNIRYYKSQPWAFSQSMLMGYFAELDGSDVVSLDDEELSEASWFTRENIPSDDSTLSLTWDMIEHFKNKSSL